MILKRRVLNTFSSSILAALLMCTVLQSAVCEIASSVPQSNTKGKILFISRRVPGSANWRMIIMNSDGSDQRELSSKNVRCASPVVSPNGEYVAFTTLENKDYYLYVIGVDGKDLTLLSIGDQYCGNPSFSPDNSKIAFSKTNSYPDTSDIYVVDINGKNEIRITSGGQNSSPSWFPSGDKILYCSQQDEDWGVYSISADGSDRIRLSPLDISLCCPKLSPDGSKIAMIQPSQDGSQIFVMDSHGRNLKQISFTASPTSMDVGFPRDASKDPVWSPDSKKIVYVSHEDSAPDIFVVNADGSNTKRLTNSTGRDENPCWTADGEYIVFSSGRKRTMQAEVFIMKSSGTKQKPLSKYPMHDIHPVWIDRN